MYCLKCTGYSCAVAMLINLPIEILYFLARKITAKGAEKHRAVSHLSPPRLSAYSVVKFPVR